MSAFNITMLQVITLGMGFGIGYLFNVARLNSWRLCVGFLAGFVVGGLASVIIWAFVLMSNDPIAAIVGGMPKSFLFSMVGAGIGVYFGRRKAKNRIPKHT